MEKKIEIVLGFECNNNCGFCSIGKRDFRKPLEQVKREIDLAAEEKPYEINFTGGEPILIKDIFDIVSYAKGKIKSVRITTNGRMLYYGDFAKRLVDSGLTGAIFSLHAPNAEIHDRLTGVEGSFNQLVKGMENLSGLVDDISINTVITTLNYRLLPEMVEKTIGRFGVKSYCLIFPTLYGNILENKHLIPKYEDIRPHAHKALEIVRGRGSVGWVLNVPPCFLDKEEQYSGTADFNTIMYWPDQRTDLDEKRKEGKIRISRCEGCEFADRCSGVPEDYYNIIMGGRDG